MILSVENLTKKYGDIIAVNNISFNIDSGKIFGFIGPNGAGKTTTIKSIAGLISFDKGNISVNDCNIIKKPQKAKSVMGYIPDTPFLYDKLTGREFLYFIARVFKMNKIEINSSIDKYASLFEFEDYMDLKTEDYSHGMKQRIIIASAFIHEPKLILIDEPMVGLDPKIAKIVKDTLREYANNGGSIFLSTHTLSLAEEICDEIGIMNKGNIVYKGNISNLKNKLKKDNLEDLFLEITKNE